MKEFVQMVLVNKGHLARRLVFVHDVTSLDLEIFMRLIKSIFVK